MAPLLIGLTGAIGSGKSTVAAMLAEHGARVVSGDELGRRVLDEDPVLVNQLISRLGADIRRPDGKLDRRMIGIRVFGNVELTRWLTELTFPGIHRFWQEQVRLCKAPVLVFDAALIFEWKIEREFDLILLVVTNQSLTVERACAGGRFAEQEIRSRLVSQMNIAAKAARADVVIENNDSLESLRRTVEGCWKMRIEPLIGMRRADA